MSYQNPLSALIAEGGRGGQQQASRESGASKGYKNKSSIGGQNFEDDEEANENPYVQSLRLENSRLKNKEFSNKILGLNKGINYLKEIKDL